MLTNSTIINTNTIINTHTHTHTNIRAFLSCYSKDLVEIIRSCMHPSPLSRPTSNELFEFLKSRYNSITSSSSSPELLELRMELEKLKNENIMLKEGVKKLH